MGVGWYYDGSGNEFPLFAPYNWGGHGVVIRPIWPLSVVNHIAPSGPVTIRFEVSARGAG